MSRGVTATHADWLTLVEPIGPFLTLPVARRVWGSGLDRTPAGLRSELRDKVEALGTDGVARRGFVDWVLRHLLSYGRTVREGQAVPATCTVTLPEHGVLLRPDFAVVAPDDETRARLLVTLWPARTDLAGHLPDDRWTASPIDRMATLCRQAGVELGLVSDGDRFVLVWAPTTGPIGRATWVMSVCAEPREASLLDSFVSVLGAKRLFSVGDRDQLEALLAESASAQAEVTAQLGVQVRRAVEMLIAAFSFANTEQRRAGRPEPLAGLDPDYVYEAACTVMMRLVFLLYAEERHLLPLGDELYDRSYAASTLRQELRDVADSIGNEETLEHSCTAWPRLLATFRAVYAGLAHDELRLLAYGGRLFDPDRFPFLEGRDKGESWHEVVSDPLPVDDRTVLAALTALQVLEMRQGGVTEARRLSFRSLDVEQIGHVYEGLLDHGTRRIEKVGVGFVGKPGEEPEVDLDYLEAQAERGEENLVAWLVEETGKSHRQVAAALSSEPDELQRRALLAACHNDASLFDRVKRYVNLLRDDVRRMPMVMHPGDIYVTEVSQRRDTGTEYTTKELADEVARYALEPLVYSPGPAEGAAPEDWKLRPAKGILELRVCDPAVGSGAIITAACRYLADRLVEAWQVEDKVPRELPTSAGDDVADVVIAARRSVAERCLYGVDRDPMAVEMAKLSLWLVTMAKDRPFSFLDHAFRAGDSLLGVTTFEQVSQFHIDPETARRPLNFAGNLEPMIKDALELRRRLEDIPVLAIRDAEEKARLLTQANEAIRMVEVTADLVVGAALSVVGSREEMSHRLASVSNDLSTALERPIEDRSSIFNDLADKAASWLNEGRPAGVPPRRCLHWPIAFPEVFRDRVIPGFDAIIGNPPFSGGTKISGASGTDYRQFLGRFIAKMRTDRADLVAFFFLRAATLTRVIGFLSTKSIVSGDTRAASLDQLLGSGWRLIRAIRSTPWPGTASVLISKLWLYKGTWLGPIYLDGDAVSGITSGLELAVGPDVVERRPYRLAAYSECSFQGSKLDGVGFAMSRVEAEHLITLDPRNRDVLRPYLSGDDLNRDPRQTPSRWVIDFFDMTLDQAAQYPLCLEIARLKVKPERDTHNRKAHRERWWHYGDKRPALYRKIADLDRVLVMTLHTKYIQPAFVNARQVISHGMVVFTYDDYGHFALLSSSVHSCWALAYASTLGSTVRYTSSDCFETFPQPILTEIVNSCGEALDQYRSALMLQGNEGLTELYNRFHDPTNEGRDIDHLRDLHRDLDAVVLNAYGWSDVHLEYDFYETRHGTLWTLPPDARTKIISRLLDENHRRYVAEQSGIHTATRTNGRGRAARTPPSPLGQGTIDWGTAAEGRP